MSAYPVSSRNGRVPGILEVLWDRPNAMTILGLVAAILAISASIDRSFHLAAALLLAAVWCDLVDGMIARRMKDRPAFLSAAGGHMDSLADVVHGGVAPGIVLIVARGNDLWSILVAGALAVAVVTRLAYFNLYGVSADGRYTGVPVFYNSLAVGFLLLIPDGTTLGITASFVLAALAGLNVSPLRIPKQKHLGLLGLLIATAGLACVHLWYIAARFPTPSVTG